MLLNLIFFLFYHVEHTVLVILTPKILYKSYFFQDKEALIVGGFDGPDCLKQVLLVDKETHSGKVFSHSFYFPIHFLFRN